MLRCLLFSLPIFDCFLEVVLLPAPVILVCSRRVGAASHAYQIIFVKCFTSVFQLELYTNWDALRLCTGERLQNHWLAVSNLHSSSLNKQLWTSGAQYVVDFLLVIPLVSLRLDEDDSSLYRTVVPA